MDEEQEHQNQANQPNLQLRQENPSNLNKQINMVTVLMICFIAEHNLPYNISKYMPDLFKNMFPDLKIAAGLKLKRTKFSEVAMTGFGGNVKK